MSWNFLLSLYTNFLITWSVSDKMIRIVDLGGENCIFFFFLNLFHFALCISCGKLRHDEGRNLWKAPGKRRDKGDEWWGWCWTHGEKWEYVYIDMNMGRNWACGPHERGSFTWVEGGRPSRNPCKLGQNSHRFFFSQFPRFSRPSLSLFSSISLSAHCVGGTCSYIYVCPMRLIFVSLLHSNRWQFKNSNEKKIFFYVSLFFFFFFALLNNI